MPAPLSQLYLVAYNSVLAVGWSVVLLRLSLPTTHGVYADCGGLVGVLQTTAFLETVHAAVGLVRTSPLLAFLQWLGRTHFLLGVVRTVPEIQNLPSVFITFAAWSISEVIRYSQYALSTMNICPRWLTYLRYTAFIILYPTGVVLGEMLVMYEALPYVKERKLHSEYGMLPFSYHSFLMVVLVSYPFAWLKLYLHMFKQRRLKLGKQD